MVASMTSSILLYTVRNMKDDVIASVRASPPPPDSPFISLVPTPPFLLRNNPPPGPSLRPVPPAPPLTSYRRVIFSTRFF